MTWTWLLCFNVSKYKVLPFKVQYPYKVILNSYKYHVELTKHWQQIIAGKGKSSACERLS